MKKEQLQKMINKAQKELDELLKLKKKIEIYGDKDGVFSRINFLDGYIIALEQVLEKTK